MVGAPLAFLPSVCSHRSCAHIRLWLVDRLGQHGRRRIGRHVGHTCRQVVGGGHLCWRGGRGCFGCFATRASFTRARWVSRATGRMPGKLRSAQSFTIYQHCATAASHVLLLSFSLKLLCNLYVPMVYVLTVGAAV